MAPVTVRYIVDDVEQAIDIIRGIGGDQVLIEDPSGNAVELFVSKRGDD